MLPRTVKLMAFSGLVVALAQTAQAQSITLPKVGKTAPTTSASPQKRTINDETAAAVAATAAPTTGSFVAKFTIKLTTAVPSGDSVYCVLSASVVDENTTTYTLNNEIEESKSTKATVSGSTATCSATIPYSWYLTSPSTDTVALSYQLYILSSTATNETGVARSSYQYVPGAGAVKVPSSGTTTTYNISATI